MFLLILPNSFGQKDKLFFYKIDGTINADTGKISLNFRSEFTPSKNKEITTQVKNKQFSFSGYIPAPQGIFLFFDERYMSADFIIEKGVQTITINVDSTRKVPQVTNKTMKDEYPKYSAFFRQIHVKWDSFYKKDDSLRTHYNNQMPEDLKINQTKEYNNLCDLDNRTLLRYIEKTPNSNLAFWRVIRLSAWGYEPIFDTIYDAFSEKLKNGYAGRVLNKKLIEGRQLSVGKQFPVLSCFNINKEKFSLDIFLKNKFTLVDFWYSRCGPCRAQFNHLRELYSQFNNKGFEIVGISIDKEADEKRWEETIFKEKLIWQQYLDINGKETRRLSVSVFPTNFFIDSTGKIVFKNISMEELDGFLSRTLK
ncbi:MAG: TlpA disulfide reductase family protein [Bacteroidales bacterium]|nr:TlpA disulfide reductase family protein [Bacteroidales bacterium]